MFASTKGFAVACITALASFAAADQPVHCKYPPLRHTCFTLG